MGFWREIGATLFGVRGGRIAEGGGDPPSPEADHQAPAVPGPASEVRMQARREGKTLALRSEATGPYPYYRAEFASDTPFGTLTDFRWRKIGWDRFAALWRGSRGALESRNCWFGLIVLGRACLEDSVIGWEE